MDRHDHDSLKSTKSNVMTGSLTCFHDNETQRFSFCISNSVIRVHRSSIARLYSIAMALDHNALMNNSNMDQSCPFLDTNHNNNRTLNDFTAISPCSNTATMFGRPVVHDKFFRKNTPDIAYPYFHYKHRSDIQRLCSMYV